MSEKGWVKRPLHDGGHVWERRLRSHSYGLYRELDHGVEDVLRLAGWRTSP